MRPTNPRIALVIGALFLVAACDEQKGSPVAPTPLTAPAPPLATSLTISGNTSIAAPGGTTQLTATAWATKDVTAEAQWRTWSGVLTVISPGVLRAERFGRDTVFVTYGSLQTRVEVRVLPEGAFLVTGLIYEASGGGPWSGIAVTQARVRVESIAGTFSTIVENKDGILWGVPALGETTVHVEKDGYCTLTVPMTVGAEVDYWFELTRCDGGG